ncbi:hypothetical protein [Quadrisphaera sp. INWT6]|uniref:hypothetical protein n=1 Tax=Quadrisphaera sp. INWT6 TaxID=2596917 RepID=UPI001892607E|nr:hypothetical protein [Quadrisphaera sp. INWT6]
MVVLVGRVSGTHRPWKRPHLQRALEAVVAEVEDLAPSVQPLTPAPGEEVCGTYAHVGTAALAALLVRLALLDAGGDLHTGLAVDDWRGARRAVRTTEAHAASPRSRSARTWLDGDDGHDGDDGWVAAVNAHLLLRDELVGGMSPRARRLLAHHLRGRSQAEAAQHEGITQPAVSQALARSGARAVVRATELLHPAPTMLR